MLHFIYFLYPAVVVLFSFCCVAHFNCRNFNEGMSCTVEIIFSTSKKVDCPNDNAKCITIKGVVFNGRKNIILRIIAPIQALGVMLPDIH